MSHHDDLPSHYCHRCSKPQSVCVCVQLELEKLAKAQFLPLTPERKSSYPDVTSEHSGEFIHQPLTQDQRDIRQFAAAALTGLLANANTGWTDMEDNVGKIAIDIATSTLAELKKREQKTP